jgi:hypothetical protein
LGSFKTGVFPFIFRRSWVISIYKFEGISVLAQFHVSEPSRQGSNKKPAPRRCRGASADMGIPTYLTAAFARLAAFLRRPVAV